MSNSKDTEFLSHDNSLNKDIFQLLSDIERTRSYVDTRLKGIQEESILKIKKGILHIEVEKYLNHVYSFDHIQDHAFNIVLTSKGSDGYGDVIWGVRTIQALQAILPNAHFSIISDALDKFRKFIPLSSNIELIFAKTMGKAGTDFTDRALGKIALEQCDLAIDGPYHWNVEHLSEIYDLDVQKLVDENRYLHGYEYDVARYWGSWTDQVTTATFLSGLGDNAYGIFIIDELKKLNIGSTSLSPVERVHHTQELQNIELKQTLTRLNSEGNCPIYFGYGEHLPAKFLEIVSRVEDKNESTQDAIILLVSRDHNALKKFTRALEKQPLENVSSIVTVKDIYPAS